jgi:C4-dicarboxylate transporter, DctM subunit
MENKERVCRPAGMSNRGFCHPLHQVEEWVAFLTIFLVAFIPFLEVVARKFFHTGIPNSTEYVHHLVFFLTFIAGMVTSREGKHLSLSIDLKLREPFRTRAQATIALLASSLVMAIAWSSLSFLLTAFGPGQKVGIFPIRLVTLIMAVGYTVMAIRFATALPGIRLKLVIAALGILGGTLLALPSVETVFGLVFPASSGAFGPLLQLHRTLLGWAGLPLIVLLVVSAFFGTPIFVVLGGIAFLLFARSGQPLEVIPNESYSLLTEHAIPAIPLFTFAGFLLSESRAGERLVKVFRSLFSWFPGGLAIMSILVCAFFTTFTGASGVTILALGALLSYALVEGKYGTRFSTGLLTASGSIGLLFPPSLPVIIYGVTAQISIKDMFIAGIVPGFLMVLALSLFGFFYALRNKVDRHPFHPREALLALKEAIWEILLPVIIALGYFGGIFTLVESAAVAVLYALLVEVVIHHDLKLGDLPQVLLKCLPVIGGVLTILALAKGLSYFIVDAEIPMQLTAWVQAHIASKYVFLLLLNVALLIVGCFMDIFSATLVVVPLIIPLGRIFGVNPIHLGIIFLANLELGYLTPPVGLNLYLASYRFNEPVTRIYRDVMPFLLIQTIAVLLITYVPFFSTGLLALVHR